MLASFVPMFLIAAAFYYLNRADQDAGTTFSWVTRTLGPWAGWIGGWAICTTGILVIGSLADVGARYFYVLVGWDSRRRVEVGRDRARRGDHRRDDRDLHHRHGALGAAADGADAGAGRVLLVFAFVALGKVYSGDAPDGSSRPQADWLSPFAIDGLSALVSALLLGVFIYWGWESAVNLTEETRDSAGLPGLPRSRAPSSSSSRTCSSRPP